MRNAFFRVAAFTVVACWTRAGVGQEPAPEFAPSTTRKAVALYLDTSGSMKGSRALAMKEGAKLAVATLDPNQELVVISFSHEASAARFALKTPADRQAAMRHIDGLLIDGGTDYLCALKADTLSAGSPGIFLSDGEHNGDPAPVLAYLKNQKPGPLYTIAVEAPPNADKLLTEMAALTGGSHVRVEHSEALVKVFLDLAKQLGNYRSYTPKEEKVECKDVVGKLIAFGFDAVPDLKGQPAFGQALYTHQAKLPGEHVHLTAVDLAIPTTVTIAATKKRSESGRLAAILRQDLLQAKMQMHAPQGKAAAGGDLKVTTQFFNSEGKVVDPRKRLDLSSAYDVLDQSGKIILQVLGKPSATKPALEATIPLPKKPGTLTVRNVTKDASQGPAFEAEEKRTIVLEKPIPLSVQPGKLQLTVREGRFAASLTVKAIHDMPLAATFSAVLEAAGPGLRLLEARSEKNSLELDLDASLGIYKGVIVVQGSASLPLETVRVPIEIIVKARSMGLVLPATHTMKIGPLLANTGSKQVATLEIPSLDADEEAYTVDVEDLSNGSAVIPCQVDRAKITPTKGKPAVITVTADIGNVPTGSYAASVLIKPAGIGNKQWRTALTLIVTEPLSAQPLDFGTVEIGKSAKRTLVLKNASSALRDVRVIKAAMEEKHGDVILTLPDTISIASGERKDVAVTLTVSPLAKSRGVHKGTVVVRRTGKEDLSIPLQVEIVGEGQGPCNLLVAPAKINLKGKPGDVQEFLVRTKFTADAAATAEDLTVEASTFKDGAGRIADIEVAFKWVPGTKLTRSAPATVQGFVVIPDRPGIFTGTLTLRSINSGTVIIPLTLEVQ